VRRLVLIAGLLVATQSPQVEAARQAVEDFRERQYQTGVRIGCALRTAQALKEQDETELDAVSRRCAGAQAGSAG
jgi:hypothetical protein